MREFSVLNLHRRSFALSLEIELKGTELRVHLLIQHCDFNYFVMLFDLSIRARNWCFFLVLSCLLDAGHVRLFCWFRFICVFVCLCVFYLFILYILRDTKRMNKKQYEKCNSQLYYDQKIYIKSWCWDWKQMCQFV